MLEIGQKYTMFEISEFMATTIKRKFVVKEIEGNKTIIQFEGKRKKYYLPEITEEKAIFKGWELPFIADSDTNSFRGNALINLVGKEHEIKDYFLKAQLNPFFDKGLICLIDGENEQMLYLSEAEAIQSGHATIRKIIEKSKLVILPKQELSEEAKEILKTEE